MTVESGTASGLRVRGAPPRAADTVELSIVMPCLNEALSLASCIRKAQDTIQSLDVTGEIVVADNGSTDGSQEIARTLGARVIAVSERGYGAALNAGTAAAGGTFVIMGDADNTYDFSRLEPFLTELRRGSDLVIGNRFQGGIANGAMPRLHRWLGNPVLTRASRMMFKSSAGDVYCGLRGFRRAPIAELDLRSVGMEYALEMVLKASVYGLRVTEVPTTLDVDHQDRIPHLRTWRDGWRSIRFLMLYSPRWLFLYPGAILVILGTIVMVALLPGVITIGAVSFDAHTMLYASAAIVMGYQCVVFYALARTFAMGEGLLPESSTVRAGVKRFRLEVGLLLGAGLFIAGFVGSGFAVGVWGAHALGHLDYSHTLRIVIPSVTAMILGLQTVLASCFMSLLMLQRAYANQRV